MPIKAQYKRWYGREFKQRSFALKEAAGWKCQDCGDVHATITERPDGSFYRVTLTLAHLNHKPWDNRVDNLRVLCARCHLNHDRPHHLVESAKTRARKTEAAHAQAGQLSLLEGDR